MLSDADLEHYQREGYLVLRGLVPAARLDGYDRRFQALVDDERLRPEGMVVMNDVMVVKGAVKPRSPLHAVNKLVNFEDDADLNAFVTESDLVTAVRDLLGPHLYSISTNVFNKPPDVDGRHPYHQDLRYFRIRPADGIVGVWTAILPATRATGCLSVLPRTHRGELLEHADPDWDYVNRGFYAVQGVDMNKRVHVELQPGDTLLFHPLLIHGSGRNRSDAFRRAISAHYASAACTSEGRDWRDGPRIRRLPDGPSYQAIP
jgi:phytanoyl-CoA hydroxylase